MNLNLIVTIIKEVFLRHYASVSKMLLSIFHRLVIDE